MAKLLEECRAEEEAAEKAAAAEKEAAAEKAAAQARAAEVRDLWPFAKGRQAACVMMMMIMLISDWQVMTPQVIALI